MYIGQTPLFKGDNVPARLFESENKKNKLNTIIEYV